METENKYKTFGELKVGDRIIVFGYTANDKSVYEVYKIKKDRGFTGVECVFLDIIQINPIDERSSMNSITFCVDDHVATYSYKTFISDVDNADKIIKDVWREQEEESKRKRLEAIREQARKNPPRFITLNSNVSKEEFIINVDSISAVCKNENFSSVRFKEDGLKISVTNDYEEIKAKLGL